MKSKEEIILINGVPFKFERESWSHEPDEVIDKQLALECLNLTMCVLKESGIKPFLMWGTLLGAIRENNFIAHDYDMDVAIMGIDLHKIENAIPLLYNNDVKLCKYKKGIIYTFNYKGVYCDIYIIDKAPFPYSLRYYSILESFIPKQYFKSFREYNFVGVNVWVPENAEKFLEYAYGKNWRIPQKGRPGQLMPRWMILEKMYYRIKRKIKYIRYKKFGYEDPDFF